MAILNLCQVLGFTKVFLEKWRRCAGRSTRRVLPWHGYGLEYLQGTAKGNELVMCA
jgi:hypothetical protein